VIYSVFGDESYDEKRKRVFAIAGLFGNEEDWDALANKWTESTKGEEFHAAKWQTDNRHGEYASLTKILAASKLLGWGVVMSLLKYESIFPDAADNDLPYYICFMRVVDHFGYWARLAIPQGTVKFTFDQNLDVEYNAAAIYNHVAHLQEWADSKFLEKDVSFSTRAKPRIQAADLWAYEVMKHMDNTIVGPKRRPTRGSLSELRKSKRFGFDMVDDDYFEGLKQHALANPRTGLKEYHAWCEKLKLQDCTSTRIRYEIYLSNLERGKLRP
jgi:hypothetical protein